MNKLSGYLAPSELISILGGITIQGVYKTLKSYNIETKTISSRKKKIPPEGVRKLLIEKGFSYPKCNISFQIVKGGVGKTSLSFMLGLRASQYGARVLLVDLDQQGNLTRSFNIEAREYPVWLNIIRDNISVEQAAIEISPTLYLIPSNLNNSRLDVELTQSTSNLKDMIKDILHPIRDKFDLVIIDCPPTINKITLSATCASDTVIIPITPDPYAMDGLDFTLVELDRIKREFKLDLKFSLVWNKYDARERLGAFYMHDIAKNESKMQNILPVVVRVDVSVKNSVFDAKSIYDLPKRSTIHEDIDQFTREIIGINQWLETKKPHTSITATA